MKPIEYLGTIYFDLMRIQPRETYFSTALSLAKAIIRLDMKDAPEDSDDYKRNKKHLDALDNIKNKTNDILNVPIAKVEAIVSSYDRMDWGRDYEGLDNTGNRVQDEQGDPVKIIDLYQMLKEALEPITMAVVDVVKDYSADWKMGGGSSSFIFGGGNEGVTP